ncbi:MAG: transcription-repair coupling factor [Pyrinomonadaceae bacterium]|nr:transcription-repair coupling factor [Pyrinomonadaceae bacterium]
MQFQAENSGKFQKLIKEIKSGARVVSLGGLTSTGAKAYIFARLQAETGKCFVVVTDSNKELEDWQSDLSFFAGGDISVDILPAMETDVYAGISPHAETLEERAVALWNLAHRAPEFLITSAKSLITRINSLDETRSLGAKLRRDEDFAPDELLEKLAASGYVREDPIKNIGEFSMRGGIIDVWSPNAENPVRIEFFGDTVDSIREFDAETQLSTEQLKETEIVPMRPFAASAQDFKDWAFFAEERFADEKFARNLGDRTQFANEGEDFSGWEFMIPLVKPRNASLFDFLGECVFVFDEPSMIEKSLESFYENLEENFSQVTEQGEIGLAPEELFLTGKELREILEKTKRVELRALGKSAAKTDEEFSLVVEGRNARASKRADSAPTDGSDDVGDGTLPSGRVSALEIEGRNARASKRADTAPSDGSDDVGDGTLPSGRVSALEIEGGNARASKRADSAPSDWSDDVGDGTLPGGRVSALEIEGGNARASKRADGAPSDWSDDVGDGTLPSGRVSAVEAQSRTISGGRGSVADPLFLFPTAELSSDFEITSRSTRKFHGNVKAFISEFERDIDRFVFQTAGIAERFSDILRDYDVVLPTGSISIGELSGGFEIPSFQLKLFTETDLFGESSQGEFQRTKSKDHRPKTKTAAFVSDFRDLKPGDFVVHVDHGIGRFEGLQTIETGGASREFMLLVYAENAKLFVPVERLDLVSRYSSGEAQAPTLDRLGGLGWQKTKAKAKRAMRDMADELLRLYAERKLVQGYAFSGDTPWQKEFEDAFPFQVTTDQAGAIDDTKEDMQNPVPMDRLVIGDVGYGKTEVAMRAAFKAVMDGKQVAVLTPTTILAYQHSETFKQRFSAFPIKIDLLSRFRSKKEQKEVVELTEKGEVDILIGTHRILSNDVKLPKLGLVVVDEEQRFGVAHKEKLKQLKKKVDVLTLSATPIPRTLNMSLLGMRDMSVIETPPRDRLAINTQVVQFSEGVIRSAIELELARDGQVFFIHNRVETIEQITAHIKKIVPNARVIFAHGQMNEKKLEEIMLDFVDYKYDVLVATTIIENGIDIPRANTIIINRADNYGLSQLYQLRGRVGRSNRRAYAYLLIPGESELTPIARRRLSAIREFSDLGAGFRIAALDLELRGAGNILGGQQSGQLDALGFDLYTKMLERTIAELKGEEIEDESSVSINLGVDVAIPNEYIQETSQRLRTYKRISSAAGEDELRSIYAEIQDRYGKLPDSVENLFEFARLRKLAEQMRLVSVDKTKDGFAVKLAENAKVEPEKLMQFLEENEGAKFSQSGILQVVHSGGPVIEKVREVLGLIRAD